VNKDFGKKTQRKTLGKTLEMIKELKNRN